MFSRLVLTCLLVLGIFFPLAGRSLDYEYDLYRSYPEGASHHAGLNSEGLIITGCDTLFIGLYQSETIDMKQPISSLSLTWRSIEPEGTDIDICVCGYSEVWTKWIYLDDGEKLSFEQPVSQVKFLVTLESEDGFSTPIFKGATLHFETENELAVPWISQLDTGEVKGYIGGRSLIDRGACAPTSIAMVLRYFGMDVDVYEVAKRCYNQRLNLLGCWGDMSHTIKSYGFDSEVRQVKSGQALKDEIQKGNPVIVSIAGCLSNAPWATNCTNGHMLVVRGFTPEGDVVCNDPGTSYAEKGDGIIYKRAEFLRAFLGHRGVMITIEPTDFSMK